MKKIGMNPVSVSVWYGGYGEYGEYRYRFGIEDMDMGDFCIGIYARFIFYILISSYILLYPQKIEDDLSTKFWFTDALTENNFDDKIHWPKNFCLDL